MRKSIILFSMLFFNCLYSAHAGWVTYDNFNDGVIDFTKWEYPSGTSGISESGGLLKFSRTNGLSVNPAVHPSGKNPFRSILKSKTASKNKGIRMRAFISNKCAIASTNSRWTELGISHNQLVLKNNGYVTTNFATISTLDYDSAGDSGLTSVIFLNDSPIAVEATNPNEVQGATNVLEGIRTPDRYTGRWINLTLYFEKPHKLRFWSSLSSEESVYRNKNLALNNSPTPFDVVFYSEIDSFENESGTTGCAIWIDHIWVFN